MTAGSADTLSHFRSFMMASVEGDGGAKERNILCLFDVDGTVTPARQVRIVFAPSTFGNFIGLTLRCELNVFVLCQGHRARNERVHG